MLLLLIGCEQPSDPPTLELPTTEFEVCAGYGLSAVLGGDPADPDIAWLEGYLSGERMSVAWPTGFTARFAPELEVMDPTGRVVLREGDYVNGSCGTTPAGRELLAPPFLALRLDCGPLPIEDCQLAVRPVAVANGWPEKDIAEIRFVDGDGRYRLAYEDGTTVSGESLLP
jgi:hypothetical protein